MPSAFYSANEAKRPQHTQHDPQRGEVAILFGPAASPKPKFNAFCWSLACGAWLGREKGLGRHVACKLLYSRTHTHTHTPLMWGRAVAHNLLLYAHYHNVFYLGLCELCAWPAVRNHLRCSYFLPFPPVSPLAFIPYPFRTLSYGRLNWTEGFVECLTGFHLHAHSHTCSSCLLSACSFRFLAFVSTCVKLQNQSIRLRIRNIYKCLMLSFIRIFAAHSPVVATSMRFHVM